jgi:peptidoglycan/LPS O-acetylase OafA/YrhL
VAVLGVVLFHAHVGLLSGGFAGVDVFFVVSGYLITRLLWTELQRNQRISFGHFYARRARRLLPAAMLVIVVTAIAARAWLPPLDVNPVMKDGVANALYVGNYRFALNRTDYLNPTTLVSPFQHYWSLGVEEQFYLIWPLLLLVGAYAWAGDLARRGQARPSRQAAVAALTAVTLGSLLLSLWLTQASQPWAFFSLPSRAWELGVGGLLGLAAPEIKRLSSSAATVLGWAGLVAIVGSFLAISSRTPFPGMAAMVPVLGAGAVLVAGEAHSNVAPARNLGVPTMRMLGRISYSWYLWHWPFLILAPYALGHALALWQNLIVVVLSGLVATATFLLVETPGRTWRWLATRTRFSLMAGATVSAAGAVSCLLVVASLPSLSGHGAPRFAAITATATPRPSGPAATDPLRAQINAVNAQIAAQVQSSVGIQQVPSNLTPSVTRAGSSNSPTFYDGCMDTYLVDAVANCAFGTVGSSTSVVLLGDSHAAMWFPAVDAAANQHGWQLYNWTKATCPPFDIPIFSPVLGRPFTECDTWRQNVLARIRALHPAMVVLGVARHYTSVYGFTPYQPPWLNDLAQMVSTIKQTGAKVVVLGPVPKPPVNVPACLSAHLASATACNMPADQVVNQSGEAAESAAVTGARGVYVNLQPWFCTAQTCATMVGNIEIWRDDNHITETYASFLGPAMSAELEAAM